MLDEEYCYKAINFDLDTKALQQYYLNHRGTLLPKP